MGRYTYNPSLGDAQYRRTVYAFWRRSSAPTFLFDSAQRRVCEVRQYRTNTPLQALTLMNDDSILDASKAIADAALKSSMQPDERLQLMSRRILSREQKPDELQALQGSLQKALAYYQENPRSAEEFLTVGQAMSMGGGEKSDEQISHPEQAAYMMIANLLFNLDETITRE